MSGLFGGGSARREQRKQAEAQQDAAERSRIQQQIANDRQLGALATDDQTASAATRRAPRGRRLFVDQNLAKTDLS